MEPAITDGLLGQFIQWLLLHPILAGFVVFLICLGESLVGVGLFIPGTVVMFSIGALIALGGMNLWLTMGCAVAGAVVGDGISFWIGRRYRNHLRKMWPFTRHPEWLARAEVFFRRHGGKSIVFGRFAGPVRPIIPAVAGMMDMPPVFFYQVNILSAFLWAPAYILPGVVLGASLSLAADVTMRLALLVVLGGGLLWFSAWLVKRAYIFLEPRGLRIQNALERFAQAHPWLWGIARERLSFKHPTLLIMLELLGVSLLAALTFAGILGWQLIASEPMALDNRIYYILQSLRTAWADEIMVLIIEIGSIPVSLSVLAVGLAWLAWRSHWHGLGYWLGGMLLSLGAAAALRHFVPVYPPSYAVSSAHPLVNYAQITVVTVIYGFLAVIIAGRLGFKWRRLPYSVAAAWILSIIFAALYLGRQWLSDILLGVALGIIWVTLLGFAYHRHRAAGPRLHSTGLLIVLGVTLVLAAVQEIARNHGENMRVYAQQRSHYTQTAAEWWDEGWRLLPRRRIDWGGYAGTPMTVQWAGEPRQLSAHLREHGWQPPQTLSLQNMIYWLVPEPALQDLPVLPNAHDGRNDVLRLIYPEAADGTDKPKQLLLRLWSSDTYLENGQRLWVGHVTRTYLGHSLGILSLPKRETDLESPLRKLYEFSANLDRRIVVRPRDESMRTGWSGSVLLLRAAENTQETE